MVPINYMSHCVWIVLHSHSQIAHECSVMKVAEVLKLHLNSIHTVEVPKGALSRCVVMAPRRCSLSEASCLTAPLFKREKESEKDSKEDRVEEAVTNSSQPPTGASSPVSEKTEAARTSRPAAQAPRDGVNCSCSHPD